MVIGLGEGVAYAVGSPVAPVGLGDAPMSGRIVALQPGCQGGTEVEAQDIEVA